MGIELGRASTDRSAGGDAGRAIPRWVDRRLWPLLATIGLIAVGMASTTWWGPWLLGKPAWSLPDDLWATLAAAQRLLHGNLGGLYTPPTRLITFPGAAVILIPLVAVIDAAGLSLQVQNAHNLHPPVWLLAGPYEIALSAVALFAADALAEHLGADRAKRAALAGASAVALWSVSVRWGHPEDAAAVGLLLYAILALSKARTGRAAWLTGAAAAANWSATFHAVTSQPNWITVDQATPWASLAPHDGSGQAVAAGPARVLAILVACGCALVAGRRWRAARGAPWSPDVLAEVLWWTAVALALRSLFEPVMVAYYLWPALAVALIAASRSWSRLIPASAAAVVLTLVSQLTLHGAWSWWTPMVAGLALTLFLARTPGSLQATPVEE